MYTKVLVAVDGSVRAEAILPLIGDIARPLGLNVVLLRVNEPDSLPAVGMIANLYLAGLASDLTARGIRVVTLVREGTPTDEILAAARDSHADLIAMTTHGRTGPSRLLFGSVAEGVLRQSDVPVVLMKHTELEGRQSCA